MSIRRVLPRWLRLLVLLLVILALAFPRPARSATAGPALAVNASAGQHPISPDI